MTQPRQQAPWIQEVIERYRGEQKTKGPFNPVGFEFQRAPLDVSPYFNRFKTLGTIGKAGNLVFQQRLANQKQIEEQERIERERARLEQQRRAIDLSGITPQFSGAPTARGKYGSPLGRVNISSGYGHRARPTKGASTFHQGLDMAAPMGTPIYATHNGVVTGINARGGYGNSILLSGGNGVQTFYGHNQKNAVKNGQRVSKGQLIGYVGSTGISTGPHLHYGVLINGKWVNPSGYYGR